MAETELPTAELGEVGTVKIYDLENDGQAIERAPIYAREIMRINRGRYSYTPPSPEEIQAWRDGEAERMARQGVPDAEPAPQPLIEAGADLEARRTLHTPSGHTLIGLAADMILKMDPHHDVNKDGTPDRRKLAGLLHVNSISKEDTDRAMALLGADTVAEAQAKAAGEEPEPSGEESSAPETDEGGQGAEAPPPE